MRLIFKITILIVVLQSMVLAVGTQFLSIPRNPVELVHGYNPAFDNVYTKPEITVSYGDWLADMTMSSIDYNRSILNGWGGLTFRYAALNDLELRTDRPTDNPLAYYNSSSFAIDGKYAKQFGIGKISTALRFISVQLYNEESNGFAADLSFQKNVNDKFNIGLALLNIGTMSELYQEQPKLPVRTIIGTTYKYSMGQLNNTVSAVLENSSLVEGLIVRASHISALDKIRFQIGSQFSDKNVSVSSGISLHLGNVQFGYGVQIGSQALGIPQYLNLAVILP